eukprot:9914537-Alexandrium_andersonii.AAC.1
MWVSEGRAAGIVRGALLASPALPSAARLVRPQPEPSRRGTVGVRPRAASAVLRGEDVGASASLFKTS